MPGNDAGGEAYGARQARASRRRISSCAAVYPSFPLSNSFAYSP